MSLLRQSKCFYCLAKPQSFPQAEEENTQTVFSVNKIIFFAFLLLLQLQPLKASSDLDSDVAFLVPSHLCLLPSSNANIKGLGVYNHQWYSLLQHVAELTPQTAMVASSLGDFVWKDCDQDGIQDPSETGIANVPVTLSGTDILGNPVSLVTFSNQLGAYEFSGLNAGIYTLSFGLPLSISGVGYTLQDQGVDSLLNSDVNPLTGNTDPITVNNNEIIITIDAGFIDIEAPALVGIPADVTVGCNNIPAVPVLYSDITATDNWSSNVSITFSENSTQGTNGTCSLYNYIIIRTWSADDGCGNSIAKVQIITVKDGNEPMINGVPADITIDPSLGEVIPPIPTLSATDECDPNVSINLSENDSPTANCGFIRTRTWTAEDACGNQAIASQTITVQPSGNMGSAGSNSPVCGGDQLLLFADGGNSYSWSGPDNFSSNSQNPILSNVNPLQAGTYTVIINGNSCIDTLEVNVLVYPEMLLTSNINNATCTTLGNILLSVTGGNGPYTYDWADLQGTNNPFDRSDLIAGTYSVTVNDAGACSTTADIIVGDDCTCSALAGTLTTAQNLICLQGPALIAATPDGNALVPSGYSILYLLTSGNDLVIQQTSTIPQFVIGVASDYNIHTLVYDPLTLNLNNILLGQTTTLEINAQLIQGGGSICAALDMTGVSIKVSQALATVAFNTPADCGQTDGVVNLSPATYTYNWSDGGLGAFRNDLAAGIYTVEAINADGCSTSFEVTVGENCTCMEPEVSDIVTQGSSCAQANGAATINVIGNPADFVFEWFPDLGTPNATNNSHSGLVAGVYQVKIINPASADCSIVVNIAIPNTDGSLVSNILTSPATCALSNGVATLLPDFNTYLWTFDGTLTNSRNDLPAGVYEVQVFDQSVPPCPNVILVEIPEVNPLVLSIKVNEIPTCQQADGVVTIDVIGGSGNYTYSWGPDATLANLAAGIYSVTVTDNDFGCVQDITFALTDAVSGATVNADPIRTTTCSGTADALADFQVSFDPGFSFPADTLISNGNATFSPTDPLAPGDYCLLISDANACLAGQACFTVIEPDPILVNIAINNQDCFQLGSIQLDVSGGNGSYNYDWADLTGPNQPSNRNDLQEGSYEVIISDANNCSRTLSGLVIDNDCSFSCVQPQILNTLVINATCGTSNGGITLEMIGNPNQYTYSWLPDLGLGNAWTKSALPSGVYEVTISNAIDPTCFTTRSIVVGNSDGPQVNILNTSPAFCNNQNGAAVLEPITLNYQWCNGATGFNPTNLPAGTCYVTVTDPVSGCTNIVTVEIAELNLLSATPIFTNLPDCNQANGQVNLQILGGSGNYDIQWSDGGQGAPRSDLMAGLYSITVTDLGSSGCVTTTDFVLTEAVSAGATVTLNSASPILLDCIGQQNTFIDFTVTYDNGFVAPADTIITDGSTEYPNGNLGIGSYCLLIRDGAGCLAGETCFEVVEPAAIEIVANITPKTCAADGTILISVSGGTGNYLFNWADIPSNNNIRDRFSLLAGIYQLTVADANNCEAYASNLIVVDECLPCPNASTMAEVIPVNSQDTNCVQLESCFDANLTNYVLLGGTTNGQSTIGSWTLGADGCLEYVSNDLSGQDTICVIAQFGTLSDTTCFIYSVFEIPVTAPTTDTIYLSTIEITAVDSCLNLTELGGVFTNSSVLLPPYNGTGTLTILDNCVNYLPNPGIVGAFIDTMVVIICNDAIPVCDTSVIIVSVTAGPACLPIFSGPDSIELVAPDCDALAIFCLDSIVPFQTQFYTLEDNGTVLSGPYQGCNLDTIFDYDLDQILSVAPTGPYELQLWVVNTDTFSLTSFLTFDELVDSMNIWDPLGDWKLEGTNITGGFSGNMYSDLDVESMQASIMDPIPLDPLFIANGTQIPLDTGFHQLIITLDSTACSDTLWIQVNCNNCPNLYSGADTLMADSCQGTALLCVDIPVADLLDFTFEDNGAAYTGTFRPCVLDTSYQYVAFPIGSPGLYELQSWEVNGTVYSIPLFTTVDQLADSMMVWDPAGNWQLFGFVIVGGAPGSVYGDLVISINGNPPVIVNPQIINDAVGILLSPGTHSLAITNMRSLCVDSFTVEVVCDTMVVPPPGADTLLQVYVGTTDTICFDNFQVITFVSNLCPDANDGNAFLQPIFGTNCIAYSGLQLGLDTFCLQICDGPICDTNIIVINVLPVLDTIPLFISVGTTDTFCLDTSIFQNPIDTVYNFCENSSGTFVNFEWIDGTVCFEYTGISPGSDTACLVICDTLGLCDTTILVVTVKQPITETIDTTVLLGDFDTLCISTAELMGNIDSFYNDCARISGIFVEFYLEDDSLCVVYEGISLGTDTACIVACDEFGICDTTYLIVTTVKDSLLLPIAIDDSTETTTATAVEIEILLNDTINGNLLNIVVIDQPLHGIVSGMGFNLVYLPDPGFCDGVDSFTYAIQNEVGWDTATVIVNVLCSDLTVYTGFSPNADGKNDTFIILGIERFPDNRVTVYNRWGNRVYESKGYTNAQGWDGSWNGQELPDGTYFYIVDDGEGRVLNGYVQIQR